MSIIITEDSVLRELIRSELKNFELNTKVIEVTMLTKNKVAKILKVSHSTVNRYIDKGLLDENSCGKITSTELDRFLKENSK